MYTYIYIYIYNTENSDSPHPYLRPNPETNVVYIHPVAVDFESTYFILAAHEEPLREQVHNHSELEPIKEREEKALPAKCLPAPAVVFYRVHWTWCRELVARAFGASQPKLDCLMECQEMLPR